MKEGPERERGARKHEGQGNGLWAVLDWAREREMISRREEGHTIHTSCTFSSTR